MTLVLLRYFLTISGICCYLRSKQIWVVSLPANSRHIAAIRLYESHTKIAIVEGFEKHKSHGRGYMDSVVLIAASVAPVRTRESSDSGGCRGFVRITIILVSL